jgi:hypothetical protein
VREVQEQLSLKAGKIRSDRCGFDVVRHVHDEKAKRIWGGVNRKMMEVTKLEVSTEGRGI